MWGAVNASGTTRASRTSKKHKAENVMRRRVIPALFLYWGLQGLFFALKAEYSTTIDVEAQWLFLQHNTIVKRDMARCPFPTLAMDTINAYRVHCPTS